MIELRAAETDDDLEAWRRVRIAILPNEHTASLEELRRADGPDAATSSTPGRKRAE